MLSDLILEVEDEGSQPVETPTEVAAASGRGRSEDRLSRREADKSPMRGRSRDRRSRKSKSKSKSPKPKSPKRAAEKPKKVCNFPECKVAALDREKCCRKHCSSIKSAMDDAKRQGPKALAEFQTARKQGGEKWFAFLKSYAATCVARRGGGGRYTASEGPGGRT